MSKQRSAPIVSVIVPIYNCAHYLPQCLESLQNQSLQDIEVILIDDGSDDGSATLCDTYAEKDCRFKTIHQVNSGVSSARNRGLQESEGRYVMFVDSDDSVEPDFCLTPYRLAEQEGADIVVFRFNLWSSNPLIIGGPAACFSGLKSSDEALRLFEYADVYVWNKLYRRELFDDITFPDVRRYEEHGVTHRLLHAADHVYFSDEVLYNYYVRGASLSSGFSIQTENERFRLVQAQTNDFRNWGLEELVFERQMRAAIRYLVKVGRDGPCSRECEKIFAQKTKALPFFSKKENALHKLFCISPLLFDFACRLGNKRLID